MNLIRLLTKGNLRALRKSARIRSYSGPTVNNLLNK